MNASTIGKVTLIAIVVLGVFTYAAATIPDVPLSSVPDFLLPFWIPLQTFFTLAAATSLVGFIVSISGYLKNYFATNHKEEYDFNKLAKTLTVWIGLITASLTAAESFAQILPAPYNEYVRVVIVVITAVAAVLTVIKDMFAEFIQKIRGT